MRAGLAVEHVHLEGRPRVGVLAEPDRGEKLAVVADAPTRPRDGQVVGEHDGEVGDVLLAGRVDQPLGERVADDGEGAPLAVDAAGVLGADHAVERAGRRELTEARGALRPDHAVLEPGEVGRLGEVGQRAHAGAVDAQRHDLAAGEVFHAVGIGAGPGGRLAFDGLGAIAAALGQRLVVLVAVAAVEQHHVAGTERPVAFSQAMTRSLPINGLRPGDAASSRSRQSMTQASPPNCQAGTLSV